MSLLDRILRAGEGRIVKRLESIARQVNALLQQALPERVWESTLAADAALTELVRGLYPQWLEMRRARAMRATP